MNKLKPFEGWILPTGEILYCPQGKHLSYAPNDSAMGNIKFTERRRKLIYYDELLTTPTQAQLDSIFDLCVKYKCMYLWESYKEKFE